MRAPTVLGGSWVVINGVNIPLIWLIITVTLLITPLITTHEPPSRGLNKLEIGFGLLHSRTIRRGPRNKYGNHVSFYNYDNKCLGWELAGAGFIEVF